MLRAIVAFGLGLLLAGCWASDQRFFDTGDWAQLNLSGEYEVTAISDSDGARRAAITARPDGLIEFTPVPRGEDMATLMGLVPIAGGSGHYFLAVDRTTSSDGDTSSGGDTYYIAELSGDGGLSFYVPNCRGTSPMDGMVAETDSISATTPDTCKFTSEEALMKAALEAERFLSAPHIVAVTPFLAFLKADGDGD